MTKNQIRLRELRSRQSQERGRMAELGMAESLDDETRSELDKIEQGVPDLERQIRAATVAVDAEQDGERRAVSPEEDAEAREIRELRERVGMGEYVAAAAEQRSADGAAKEYNQALGISGNRFPLSMLAPREERAVTGVDTTTMPTRWLDRLFADSAAMNVGVTFDTAQPGVSSHPVTATGASAAARGKTEDAVDAAWTISVTELKPKRNAVRLLFSIEDTARIPGLESALTRDLSAAMVEGIDRSIFLGDATASGTDADITGLSTASGLSEVTITQANKILGPGTLAAFTGLVDGIHANGLGDLRTVTSVGAWRLWQDSIINASADNQTLASFLREAGLSWMARGSIDDATADGDFAAFIGRAKGIEGAAVAAVWEAGELIRDPYSSAAGGEIALTLCYLWDFAVVRASNFARVTFAA